MRKIGNVYEPHEDSFLLLRSALSFLKNKHEKKICEVGVGSGFVLSSIARKYSKHKYFGTDINPDAISLTRKEFSKLGEDVLLKKTNLLDGLKEKFDLIVFNTPYLPMEKYDKFEDLSLKDRAIYGGKKGYEVIDEFVLNVGDFLEDDGDVLMLFSSHSNLKHIKKVLSNNFYDYEIFSEKRIFFENLYVFRFWKSKVLKQLSKDGLSDLKYLTKGKHSKILSGKFEREDVVVKIGEAKDIQIEEMFLKKLQEYDFVPKLFLAKKNYVVMEKLSGLQIRYFLDTKRSKKEIEKVFDNIFDVTRKLDELGMNKFELTNPVKHIFIDNDFKVKFIDFERMLYSPKPKNTTQVLQFVRFLKRQLGEHGVFVDEKKILDVSSKYKKEPFEFGFKDLLKKVK